MTHQTPISLGKYWKLFPATLMAFENQNYVAYDCFYGNGPYGKIPTKKEPIRTETELTGN